MKTELWNGHVIRFVEIDGEWWAVAKDVSDALGFLNAHNATHKLKAKYKGTAKVITPSGEQEMITLSEKGLYRLIMRSNKPEAEEFQDWAYEMIQELRRQSGLEGFQIFRMMDKEHQKDMMGRVKREVKPNGRIPYITANSIANKAVSNMHGLPKKIGKGEMTPQMLVDRQAILDETVELMGLRDKYNLEISVSKTIYGKYN